MRPITSTACSTSIAWMRRGVARCWPTSGGSSWVSRSRGHEGVRSESSPILPRVTVRVVFLGNDRLSVPPLEAIIGEPDLDPVLIVTNPAKPAGPGSQPTRTAVAEAPARAQLPLLQAGSPPAGSSPQGPPAAPPPFVVG